MNEKEEKEEEKRREENIRIKTYSPPAILSFAFMMIRRKEGKKAQSSREKERSRTRRAKRERTEK